MKKQEKINEETTLENVEETTKELELQDTFNTDSLELLVEDGTIENEEGSDNGNEDK